MILTEYTARLQDDATGEVLPIRGSDADPQLWIQQLAVGGPDIRAVSIAPSSRNGTLDTTKFFGASAVTMNITVGPNAGADGAYEFAADLLGWCAPGRRPYLYVQRSGWKDEWRIQLRGDQYAPVTVTPSRMAVLQLAFRAPDGCWESATVNTTNVLPGGSGTGGFQFPISFPLTFGSGVAPGSTTLNVGGNIEAFPMFDIYGPCSNPTISMPNSGLEMKFTSLSIPAGEYVEIDSKRRTIYANSDPTTSRLATLDPSVSDYLTLGPGADQINFVPATAGPGCKLVVNWRDRRLA